MSEEKLYAGIPRREIPWYPRINYELCIGCGQCYNFCPHGVYEWDEEKDRPVVVNPYECVIGCVACGRICDQDAISFPKKEEINDLIKRLREKYAHEKGGSGPGG